MFEVDTTGTVICKASVFPVGEQHMIVKWSDLTPFMQGYVEAMLQPHEALHYSLTDRFAGFSDLAPETLARIIADCEAYQAAHHSALEGLDGPRRPDSTHQKDGAMFWHWRNKPGAISYSPLTVTLGDDGKIRFA